MPIFKVAWNELIYCWEGPIIVKKKKYKRRKKQEGEENSLLLEQKWTEACEKAVARPKEEGSLEKNVVATVQFFSDFNWESVVNFFFYLICSWGHFI